MDVFSSTSKSSKSSQRYSNSYPYSRSGEVIWTLTTSHR